MLPEVVSSSLMKEGCFGFCFRFYWDVVHQYCTCHCYKKIYIKFFGNLELFSRVKSEGILFFLTLRLAFDFDDYAL